MKKTLITILMLLTAGCASPAPHFYQPVAVKAAETIYPKFRGTVLVQQILLPAETSRPQITTTGKKDFELKIDEFNRWGAAPDKLMQQVISENLGVYLPNAVIENRTPLKKNYKYAVAIEISKMGGRLGEEAILNATYFIKNTNGNVVKSGKLNESVAIKGGYDDYIPAQSRLLGALTAQIAADLAGL